MKITNEWRATGALLGIAFILSFWGLGRYAGCGLLGAGIFNGIRLGLNEHDKRCRKQEGATK